VYVDGTFQETTDQGGEVKLEVESGQHQIFVQKDGFKRRQKTVRVVPEETRTLSFTLRKEPSSTFGLDSLSLLVFILAGTIAVAVLSVAMVVLWRRYGPVMIDGEDSFNRYRGLEPISTNGITAQYRATDSIEDRPVVLEVLDEAYEDNPGIVEAFLEHGEALRQIAKEQPDAPVVDAYRYGREKAGARKRTFLELEHVQGETLSALLRGKSLEVQEALTILEQVCRGLQSAHDRNLYHGRLSPNTIIVTRTEPEIRVKLVNFQVDKRNRFLDESEGQVSHQDPAYMSPEQQRGKGVDESTDVYAGGMLFCTLITGSPPHADRYLHTDADQQESVARRCFSEAPSCVEPLLRRMLQRAPEKRPTAIDVVEEIDLLREKVQSSNSGVE